MSGRRLEGGTYWSWSATLQLACELVWSPPKPVDFWSSHPGGNLPWTFGRTSWGAGVGHTCWFPFPSVGGTGISWPASHYGALFYVFCWARGCGGHSESLVRWLQMYVHSKEQPRTRHGCPVQRMETLSVCVGGGAWEGQGVGGWDGGV